MSQETSIQSSSDAATTIGGRRASLALIVVLFASFMDLLDGTIVMVAAPDIAADLHATGAQLQWMLAAYTLALGSALITGGRLGDDHGRRRVFLASLAVFALASAACALSPSAGVLIALRAAQGAAAGFMVPQVFGIIRSSFDDKARTRAFGAYGAVQGLASVAGPLLGGALVTTNLMGLGWRTVFWVNVPVAVVAWLLGRRVLPESSSGTTTVLDVRGAILSAISIVLVLLPLVQGREWGWPWWGRAVLVAGLVLFGLFWRAERRLVAKGGQPVFDPRLLRLRGFVAGLGAATFFFGAIGPFFLALSIYLQQGTGRSAWQTGLVILPYAVGSILTSGLGVALSARAGRLLLIVGSLLLAVSQVWLWWLVDCSEPGYWTLSGPLFVGGLGLGLAAPILVNVVLAAVPGRQAGAAGAILSTLVQIGGAMGVAVLGTVFFAAVQPGNAAGGYAPALGAVLPWEAVAHLMAAFLMLALPKAAPADR